MKIKLGLMQLAGMMAVAMGLFVSVVPAPAMAADNCDDDHVYVAVPVSGTGDQAHCIPKNQPGGPIVAYLKFFLKVLSGAVGGVIVLMLVVAGIQYITSTGDPTNIKSAKNRIINAITALALFLLMFAFLQFLIPGGIL